MVSKSKYQWQRAIELLRQRGMMRLSEFLDEDITATTISRMLEDGKVSRLSRGLYQLPHAATDTNHSLAEVAKRIPKGVICLVSALAYHELTDTIPSRVWVAIGPKDRQPNIKRPRIQVVRFRAKVLRKGIRRSHIENVAVRVYSPAKTVVDMFRYRESAGKRYQRSPGLALALEGLREALRQRKATPAEIARYAEEGGVWKAIRPYLEAMTANG